jgi:hypothetical protein
MRNIRIILGLLLTAFCGAGGSIFLTFTNQSLFGAILYMAFPFAVGVLFMTIEMEVLSDRKRAGKPEAKVLKSAEKNVVLAGHHPKAA